MTGFSSASPFWGTLILTRVFSHLLILAGLLACQLAFRDFVNPSLSVPLYFVCAAVFLTDGLFVSLDPKPHGKSALILFLFLLDSVFLGSLILFLGLPGLTPVLLLTLFLFFAFRLYAGWWGLACFALWTAFLFFTALLWRGEVRPDDRFFTAFMMSFALFVNFLAGGFIGGLLRGFYSQISALRERSFFDPDRTDRPAGRMEPALNLARKIKPVLTSLLRNLSGPADPASPGGEGKGPLKKPDEKQLKQSERQIRQFQRFVEDFIAFAQPEKISLTALDFNKLVQKTLKGLSSHPDRPAGLKERLELRSAGWVNGSPAHLEEALTRIFVNAFQAVKIRPRPFVETVSYDEEGRLILEISDNGQGLEEKDVRRAFEPLFSRRLGLRGMGLSLAFKIIKSHGGSVSLSSVFQKGAKIRIELPLLSPKPAGKIRLSA